MVKTSEVIRNRWTKLIQTFKYLTHIYKLKLLGPGSGLIFFKRAGLWLNSVPFINGFTVIFFTRPNSAH